MAYFYLADWHFGHKNSLGFDNRPFESVEKMNAVLVLNWNKTVSSSDTVFILGDMFWCSEAKAIPILKHLNGKKILIRGNHDRCQNKEFIEQFESIHDYLEILDDDECGHTKNIVLCHYPIPCFKNHYYGWYHFYGHVHNSFEENMMQHCRYLSTELYDKPCNMINVGVMMPWINYTPRTFNEIVSEFNKKVRDQYGSAQYQ